MTFLSNWKLEHHIPTFHLTLVDLVCPRIMRSPLLLDLTIATLFGIGVYDFHFWLDLVRPCLTLEYVIHLLA